MKNTESFVYTFSMEEVKAVVKVFRGNEKYLDPKLDFIMSYMEKFLYNNMTIDEAEVFFS